MEMGSENRKKSIIIMLLDEDAIETRLNIVPTSYYANLDQIPQITPEIPQIAGL